MAYNFYEVAKDQMSGSPIMRGRDKITVDEIIKEYPNGITVTEFDIITSDGHTFPVCAFAEDEKHYFNGGQLLGKIVNEWVSGNGGDVHATSDALKKSGGVKFILEKGKTKQGRTVTRFTPVERVDMTDDIPF